jgi:transcriptional regulator with XRE-family HTH domain
MTPEGQGSSLLGRPHFATVPVVALTRREVGERIRQARNQRYIDGKRATNRWIADQMGKSERAVARWMAGQNMPSVVELGRLAELLDVPKSFLVEDESPQTSLQTIRDLQEAVLEEVRALRRELGLSDEPPAEPGAER